jgi:hypothetical protein
MIPMTGIARCWTSAAVAIAACACGSGEAPVLHDERAARSTVSEAPSGPAIACMTATMGPSQGPPSSVDLAPVSDLVPSGSAEQRSTLSISGLVEGAASQPIAIDYFETPEGGISGPYVSYRVGDEHGPLLAIDIELEVGRTWHFEGSSPIVVRTVDLERAAVVAGELTLTMAGDDLRLDLLELEPEGTTEKLSGYVVGSPVERCRNLVEQTAGATAPGIDSRAHEIDEDWSSPFCAGIKRRFAER